MPHLQREAEYLVKQAEKIAGLSDNEGQVTAHQKRRSRHGPASSADNVILSSKFVVDVIRNRYDGDESEPFWLEFQRADADALEKRGIEVLNDPDERPPRKKITIVKIAEPASFSRIEFPQKRTAKGKISTDTASFPSPPDRGAFYHLTVKDMDWLEVYNSFCNEKKWTKLSPGVFETMLTSLDTKKNELTLAHLKSDISATNRTTEGTAKRHEKDYFVLQKFIAYTATTFDQLDHLNLGRSLGLTTQTAFDIWEYWKLKVQDNFYQPLVFPPASVFDYRRISLLAAWNMTTVNYAQRLRHDAERIRLMYDLLQKRNHTTIKVMAREEELAFDLAQLSMVHPEAKSIPPDLLNLVIHYMHELSAQNQPDSTRTLDPRLEPLRDWVESSLTSPPSPPPVSSALAHKPLAVPRTPAHLDVFSPALPLTRPATFPPLDIKPAPNIRIFADKTGKPGDKRELEWKKIRTRGAHRSDLPKNITFEHADNSCCENGPMDDEDALLPLGKGSLHVKAESVEEEPLYLLNSKQDDLVLQEIYPALEFRTRLRSYKKTI